MEEHYSINLESIIASELLGDKLAPLRSHHYPWSIKLFILAIFLIFVYAAYDFIKFELHKHITMAKELQQADQSFRAQKFWNSVSIYSSILSKYPNQKDIRIKLVYSYFAVAKDDKLAFWYGVKALGNSSYS